jgi:hypothetical protein
MWRGNLSQASSIDQKTVNTWRNRRVNTMQYYANVLGNLISPQGDFTVRGIGSPFDFF